MKTFLKTVPMPFKLGRYNNTPFLAFYRNSGGEYYVGPWNGGPTSNTCSVGPQWFVSRKEAMAHFEALQST